MSRQPAEELASDIRSLERRVESLESSVRLTRLRDVVEDLSTTANGLVDTVKAVRARGYVFEKGLERTATDLKRQWSTLGSKVLNQIDKETPPLERKLRSVEDRMRRLVAQASSAATAKPILERADAEVGALEEKVKAAERSIEGMYDTYKGKMDEFAGHLRRIDWMLGEFAAAKFQLLPTEGGIMAVKAKWDKGGKDDPHGVLYITDQRLLFEQKQELATKKVLFVVTEKEKVQQLLMEVPLGQIEDVQASKKGMLGHEDHIDIAFASGAPLRTAHFHLDGQDSNMWQELIGRAKTGDFDKDRAVPIDREAAEKAKTAPTKCPNCGAPITQQVLRGMDSLKCDYCGHVVRL